MSRFLVFVLMFSIGLHSALGFQSSGKRYKEAERVLKSKAVDLPIRIQAAADMIEARGVSSFTALTKYALRTDTPWRLSVGIAETYSQVDDLKFKKKIFSEFKKKRKKVSARNGPSKPKEPHFFLIAAQNLQGEEFPAYDDVFEDYLVTSNSAIRLEATQIVERRKAENVLEVVEKMVAQYADNKEEASYLNIAIGVLYRTPQDVNARYDILERLVGSDSAPVQDMALKIIVEEGYPELYETYYPLFLESLHAERWFTRLLALQAIVRDPKPDALGHMVEQLPREGGKMRTAFIDALYELTDQPRHQRPEVWKKWWEKEGKNHPPIPSRESIQKKKDRIQASRDAIASSADIVGIPIKSRRIVFLLDASGSMGDQAGYRSTRMKLAKRELMKTIELLRSAKDLDSDPALFDIVSFSDVAQKHLEGGLTNSLDFDLDEIKAIIDKITPGGGTNIYGGLLAAFSDPNVDTVFFLSDGGASVGKITDPLRLCEEFRRINLSRGIVIHGISLYADINVVKCLSEMSGGTYKVVTL